MRTCSKGILVGYAVFGLIAIGMISEAKAQDFKYMKIDDEIGGYITLTTDLCEIDEKKAEYTYKAIEEAGNGETRRACWYRAEPIDDKHLPNVIIVEEMLYQGKIIYNVGSIAQYYFKDTKD